MHVQVKAENEKLKRLLTAPLRTQEDREREQEKQDSAQDQGGRAAMGIPKKPKRVA